MAIKKKSQKLEDDLKQAAASIGKSMASSQVKIEKTRKQAMKGAGKLVSKLAHSAEDILEQTSRKIKEVEEKISGGGESGSNRFRSTGKKTIAESIGLMAEETRLYVEEHEEIGVARVLNIMKSRGHSEAMVFAAIGWLMRDQKISISSDGKKISLR